MSEDMDIPKIQSALLSLKEESSGISRTILTKMYITTQGQDQHRDSLKISPFHQKYIKKEK